MDSLTHVLSGVVMAKAGLAQRYGRGTTLFLVVAANLPDIDAALGFFLDDAFLFRRGVTHSVVGIPLLALAAAGVARRFTRAIPFAALVAMALAALIVHVLLDFLNSYGVMLLAPFSHHRFELAWVFIVDLVVWALLAAPLLVSPVARLLRPRIPPKWLDPRRVSQASLVLLMLYILATGLLRTEATRLLAATIKSEQLTPDFHYVFPEALGPHRFRGVVRQGSEYRLYLLDLPRGQANFARSYTTELDDPLVARARQTKEGQRLEWFFKAPVWRPLPPAGGARRAEAEVFDLRFVSTVVRTGSLPFLKRVAAD